MMIYKGDPDADRHAYALATNSWKAQGKVLDREDVVDAVKSVFDMAADGECPQCAHQMADD
ncbi:hypothetical protein [Methylobacterium nonmethylotrophicum]|uniref:Uncharacterized protein n=1 Tax=Methylobacterium nonmethylotrophicum TaxID=1141884 RepID=A0A4Z0NDF9_9HYPH|nr:hypothetical protein [Methylobacterium nonmethylotrophicum]TGD93717.1 hypothetical protein EU555_33045 [Methylobacterium nonmethylotrophicum]